MNLSGFSARAPQVLSLLRIVAGLMFMQHGTQKIFGFPEAARGPFELMTQMGIGGVLELVGGALIVLGLFTRPVAFILSGMMAVAYFQFHAPASLYPLVNGGELAALYCWVFLYLFFAGPGAWSLDEMMGKKA
ncbi:MAG: DoxX family protein [Caulobacterales bacterium]|nr:DoxX family protein [Caulobacterales bacterium]